MEGDGDRPHPQKTFEAHELASFVRQNEVRHGIADLRRAGADRHEPHHEAVDRLLHRRAERPRSCGEGIEPLAQGGIHVAAIAKGLVERMEDWSGHLQVRLPREGRPWHGERGRRLAISSRTSLTSRCASAAPFELRVAAAPCEPRRNSKSACVSSSPASESVAQDCVGWLAMPAQPVSGWIRRRCRREVQ